MIKIIKVVIILERKIIMILLFSVVGIFVLFALKYFIDKKDNANIKVKEFIVSKDLLIISISKNIVKKELVARKRLML